MQLLLDSHTLIWAGNGDRRLSRRAAAAITDPRNDLLVSVVTFWEIEAKQRRHTEFRLAEPLRTTMDRYGLLPLDLTFDVPSRLQEMPGIHGDPFDRMLVAQAIHHDLVMVTHDKMMKRYPVETWW